MKESISILLATLLIVPAPVWAGVRGDKVMVIASTENAELQKQAGYLSFPGGSRILFQSDAEKELAISCSDVTHTSFTRQSKLLKKVAIPAVAGAIFTMGISLVALAYRSHGYFLVVDYGKGEQAVFALGKDVYEEDINTTSACTGKPTEILK